MTVATASIQGWENYPDNLPFSNPFCNNGSSQLHRLDENSSLLFATNKVELRVIDANASSNFVASARALTRGNAEQHIGSSTPDLRVISLVREHSLTPLYITKDLLLKILFFHQVGPCFLDLLLASKGEEELWQKGHSFWSSPRVGSDIYEICYQFKYVERKTTKQGPTWSERHLGVYHKFGGPAKATLILLNAGPNSELQRRIESAFQEGKYRDDGPSSPLLLHAMVFGTYLDNWDSFLHDLGQTCMKKENRYLTRSLMELALSFVELQELRHYESRLLVASTVLTATLDVIKKLEACGRDMNKCGDTNAVGDMGETFKAECQAMETLGLRCKGYIRSAEVISNRINKLLSLLSDGLDQQSQNTSSRIATSTFDLTQKSVGDNAIVRVVTVITLIYLPMQAVATFFGMNLTSLPEATNRIRFADNWWLFLATALPLTAMTLGILGFAMRSEFVKRQKGTKQQPGAGY